MLRLVLLMVDYKSLYDTQTMYRLIRAHVQNLVIPNKLNRDFCTWLQKVLHRFVLKPGSPTLCIYDLLESISTSSRRHFCFYSETNLLYCCTLDTHHLTNLRVCRTLLNWGYSISEFYHICTLQAQIENLYIKWWRPAFLHYIVL